MMVFCSMLCLCSLFSSILTKENTVTHSRLLTPDYPPNWKTETERIHNSWNTKYEQKWVEYVFDSHFDIEQISVQDGQDLPQLGFGTFSLQSSSNERTDEQQIALLESLHFAIRLGYRLISTSLKMNNFHIIAQSIQSLGIRRNSIKIAVKISSNAYGFRNVQQTIFEILRQMKCKHIDICIMETPKTRYDSGNMSDEQIYQSSKLRRLTWEGLEQLKDEGICLSLGIGNYLAVHIQELLQYARYLPSVNYLEYHPFYQRHDLLQYCINHHIIVVADNDDQQLLFIDAYVNEDIVQYLGKKYMKSEMQILLKWQIMRGLIVIPSESKKRKIAENSQIFNFELEYEDISLLNELNRGVSLRGMDDDVTLVGTVDWKKKAFYQRFMKEQMEEKQVRDQVEEKEVREQIHNEL